SAPESLAAQVHGWVARRRLVHPLKRGAEGVTGPRTIKEIGMPTPTVCQTSWIAKYGEEMGTGLARLSGNTIKSMTSQTKAPKIRPTTMAPRVPSVAWRSRLETTRRAA